MGSNSQSSENGLGESSVTSTKIDLVGGTCVVDGYGIKISVERGQLHISDGTGRNRRHLRIGRAERKLTRLVLVGHTGFITIDALRWLNDTDAAFVHIDEGRLLTTTAPRGTTDGRLRRAQALLPTTTAGLGISRQLITDKLRAQAAILTTITGQPAPDTFARAFKELNNATDINAQRVAEAQAAMAYWQPIATLPLTWAPKHPPPAHWETIGPRQSGLANMAGKATTPAHAIWNYMYALLEAETTLAIHTLGLDPTLGISHQDQPQRNSLTFDLMEPLRPRIDTQILQLLNDRTFATSDFHETREGVTRINPPLTHDLAHMATAWHQDVYRTVRQTAAAIAKTGTGNIRIRGANRKAAKPSPIPTLQFQNSTRKPTCRQCGSNTPNTERVLCDPCHIEHQAAERLRIPKVGTDALTRWRANATPQERAEGEANRVAALRKVKTAQKQWRQANPNAPTDVEWYDQHIRPHLHQLTRGQIANATGFKPSYATRIRNGQKTPHPMHWLGLQAIIQS